MADPFKTVKQVSQKFGISQHAVLNLIKSGQIAAFDVSQSVGGRPRWRILEDSLESFISGRTYQRPTPKRRRKRKPTAVKRWF
jgi:hypothetical protein